MSHLSIPFAYPDGICFTYIYVVLIFLVGVFVVLSYPVRWHLICL